MSKVKSIIMVVADWEEASGLIKKICEKVSQETKVPVEERREDWGFLVAYGEKDEYGGTSIPQVLLRYEDGSIKHILTGILLTPKGKPDVEGIMARLKEYIEKE